MTRFALNLVQCRQILTFLKVSVDRKENCFQGFLALIRYLVSHFRGRRKRFHKISTFERGDQIFVLHLYL